MSQQYIPPHDDEIDLFELMQTLWGFKWLIAGITALFTAFGAVYALSLSPVYEAQAHLMAPRANEVFQLNPGVADVGLTPAEVYERVQSNLQSADVRRRFFEHQGGANAPASRIDLNSMNAALSIHTGNTTRVVMELDNPELAAQWVNELIAYVAATTVDELVAEVNQNITAYLRRIDLQLDSLRALMEAERLSRIAVLEEALSIAQSIGLQESMIENAANQLNMEYMRGSRALMAEINVLRNRMSDEPFMVALQSLSDSNSLAIDPSRLYVESRILSSVEIEPDLIRPIRITQTAEPPSRPNGPNRSLIIALSVILGGMVGVFAALILSAVRKRQQST